MNTGTDTDILLLLDCYYAAQAARARGRSSGKFEILAAAAMGVMTLAPGDMSFTSVLLAEIRSIVDSEGVVDVKDLHGRLCGRQKRLFATPVHIYLKSGQQSIRLHPLSQLPSEPVQKQGEQSFLRLLVQIREDVNAENIGQITQWLKTDMPSIVSRLEVVLDATENLQQAVDSIDQREGVLGTLLRPVAKAAILRAWNSVVTLVEGYCRNMNVADAKERGQETANFVDKLEMENGHVIDLVEQEVLTAPSPDRAGPDILDEAVKDTATKALGITTQLSLCKMIRASPSPTLASNNSQPSTSPARAEDELLEVKQYGPYTDPKDLPSIDARVRLLAGLLTAPKAPTFRSLQCTGCFHNPLTHSYTLRFRTPPYLGQDFVSLNCIIDKTRGIQRPTLNERLKIAHTLARAVQKWHLVS